MGSKPIALLSSAVGGTALLPVLPVWCVVTVALVAVALAAVRVIVTQVIRLRASSELTTSAHALRVLELENGSGSAASSQP
ncbi:Putative membrane protein [Amycolatopsis japonica]|uniref:Putative membrane protein n=1 Tax=Amycolatopsis japonica TaxID=208439 RepID=A0A075UY30_9PSEU|nr:hypothetical protein [Amycolatopsis japonica]AIG77351.1 Putative membrane protein [Amycolatopsis japonica]